MNVTKVDLTTTFRCQSRVITPLLDSVDVRYLDGELSNMYAAIVNDVKINRLQESYSCYLYGASFVKYVSIVQSISLSELRKKGLSGFRLTLSEVGSKSELATYPTLCGIKVTVSTVN